MNAVEPDLSFLKISNKTTKRQQKRASFIGSCIVQVTNY